MELDQGLPEDSWMDCDNSPEYPINTFNANLNGDQPESPPHSPYSVIPSSPHVLSNPSSEHLQPQQAMLPNGPGHNAIQSATVDHEPETSQTPAPRHTQGHYVIPLLASDHIQDGQSAGEGSDFSAWDIYHTCPYYVRDPILHFRCINKKLDSHAELKKHLGTNHAGFAPQSLEVPTCGSCGTTLENNRSKSEHKCMPKCSDNELKVSRQAWEALKGRSVKGTLDKKKWDDMWYILFHKSPGDKFAIRDTVMNRFIDFIKTFCDIGGGGFGAVLPFLEQRSPNREIALFMLETFIKLLDVLKAEFGAVANERRSGTGGWR
ncbi:hypothetical protein FCIRC_7264 [Fusarium circinatum]|uniref:C2H2-type domain-containing protein n=1 Tax=Fusarium circinatum TaxID=48490 RepID=A0A8H5TTL6_FUSCI|nr:hypothetical protein FCIRC_7264 [Fusarium circinatum]